jgi:hypothetical protein
MEASKTNLKEKSSLVQDVSCPLICRRINGSEVYFCTCRPSIPESRKSEGLSALDFLPCECPDYLACARYELTQNDM